MFTAGNYYLERVATGKLTFDVEGVPTSSPMQRGPVFDFKDPYTVTELRERLQLLPPSALDPNTAYMRLFRAPTPTFDTEGELIRPRFMTEGFLKVDDEFWKIAKQNINMYVLCNAGLSKEVLAFFEEDKQPVCPLATSTGQQ